MVKKVPTKRMPPNIVKHDKRYRADTERREKPLQVVFNPDEFAELENLTEVIKRRGDPDFKQGAKGITLSSVIRVLIAREAQKQQDGIVALRNAKTKMQEAMEGV